MPYLQITTNVTIPGDDREGVLADATRELADALGKSEKYVMVQINTQSTLAFGGTSEPAALIELTSLGLTGDDCPELSRRLTAWVANQFAVSSDRIFVRLAAWPRTHWAWNGKPFA